MLNVLDIDIDLFVDPRASSKPRTGPVVRLGPSHTAWPPGLAKSYIDTLLGKRGCRFDGSFHESHEAVLTELLTRGDPVRLFHLDAHADLGIGQITLDFAKRFLAISKSERINQLGHFAPNEGDWCLYEIACGIIKEFHYITHPDVRPNLPDIPIGMDKWEGGEGTGTLTVSRFTGADTEFGDRGRPETPDTSVPLSMHWRDSIRLTLPSIDLCFITRSPRYTPPESDETFDLLVSSFL